MTNYRFSFSFLLAAIQPLVAQMLPMDFSQDQKIAFQNSILAKVNDTTISMLDVKKHMDLLFHQHYGHLSESNQARYQFYEASWRRTLMELVDNELILSDAADKEIKLTDGEIREEMENRFGPGVSSTLDKIGLTYDEAWKMLKNEITVRRMTWWFVHSRAIQSVTPGEIRKAYQAYLKDHPPYQELSYRILSLRGKDLEAQVEKIAQCLQQTPQDPDIIAPLLIAIEPSLQLSHVYTLSDLEISDAHKTALKSLKPGEYSQPVLQASRFAQEPVARIFYLIDRIDHPAPSFQELSVTLREELVQKAVAKESQGYVGKLRKHYGFDAAYLHDRFPEDFHPFSIQ